MTGGARRSPPRAGRGNLARHLAGA